jgi:saccharopine dehydrogenase-like NADP-dependent oxidoreductase
MVIADYDVAKAEATHKWIIEKHGAEIGAKFSTVKIDASDKDAIVALARQTGATLIMNAVDPIFDMPIFDAAFEAGATYLDMAMSLSHPHPTDPFNTCGVRLGDEQLAKADEWKAAGHLALLGIGVEPGLADVFAKYAADYLFSEIDQVNVRDGANLVMHDEEGNEIFAPSFSMWTTIEECLNPPMIWEKGKGWFTTEPFSEPETFTFPEGIGDIECVNVEHEEVSLAPLELDCNRVTFKYGLGDEFINILKVLHTLGLDSTTPIPVKSGAGTAMVAPRDLVAATVPDPATIGPLMTGKTCAGTWVTGKGKDGKPRSVYLYHVADNQWTMDRDGTQCVVWQTAINPVIAMELLATGVWQATGVVGPEAFDAKPFLELMKKPLEEGGYGSEWGMDERTPVA